jgi:hypothetical protein
VLLAVPLVLVNTAAIWGQAGWGYSHITSPGWDFRARATIAVLFACAVESIGVYLAYEGHLALMADQASGGLRVGSYGIGALVGALNFLHFREQSLPTAIAFGCLSAVSPWLWAIYSRARNRTRLAALDQVDQRGVKLSTSRKLWHPIRSARVISWAAWAGITNPSEAVEGWERYRASKSKRATAEAVAQPSIHNAGSTQSGELDGANSVAAAELPAAQPLAIEPAGPATDVSELLEPGRQLAAELEKKGLPLTRAALVRGLREMQLSCSTDRATELRRQLLAERTDSEPDVPDVLEGVS